MPCSSNDIEKQGTDRRIGAKLVDNIQLAVHSKVLNCTFITSKVQTVTLQVPLSLDDTRVVLAHNVYIHIVLNRLRANAVEEGAFCDGDTAGNYMIPGTLCRMRNCARRSVWWWRLDGSVSIRVTGTDA